MGSSHDNVCPSTTSGMDYIRNPRLFKGMGKCLIKQTLSVDPIQVHFSKAFPWTSDKRWEFMASYLQGSRLKLNK